MADGRELPALDAKEQTADEKLKADAKAWKQTLKEAWEGNMPESQMLKVMETPLALQLAGAKPLPLYMRQSKLMKIRGKHPEMTKAVLSELPKHLADPMIVFKSATKPGRIVVGLSLLDADGINVVVPVELDAGKAHTEINVVLSTYGKGSTSHGVNYGWFSRNIHTGNTLYVNKKQVADLYQSAGLQLPMEGRRFNDLFGSSIKTDADLVKMRAANRSKYSASMQLPRHRKKGMKTKPTQSSIPPPSIMSRQAPPPASAACSTASRTARAQLAAWLSATTAARRPSPSARGRRRGSCVTGDSRQRTSSSARSWMAARCAFAIG